MITSKLLKRQINSDERAHFIKVNNSLLFVVCKLANLFPKPTMDNLQHPNSKRLLGIAERYEKYEGNARVKRIVTAVLRILISKIEHSPNYRDRFSWFIEELMASGWKPRSYNHPVNAWNEPKPYGRQIEW